MSLPFRWGCLTNTRYQVWYVAMTHSSWIPKGMKSSEGNLSLLTYQAELLKP